jgi:hypothetical protein
MQRWSPLEIRAFASEMPVLSLAFKPPTLHGRPAGSAEVLVTAVNVTATSITATRMHVTKMTADWMTATRVTATHVAAAGVLSAGRHRSYGERSRERYRDNEMFERHENSPRGPRLALVLSFLAVPDDRLAFTC